MIATLAEDETIELYVGLYDQARTCDPAGYGPS